MKTILLIEDNFEIRENTCELLELEGYSVVTAANGKIGFGLALEKKPDLILCDILMPEMNGYEVFERLSSNSHARTIPFIFITASVEKSEVKKGLNMGASGYIKKPFESDELMGMIHKYLNESDDLSDPG